MLALTRIRLLAAPYAHALRARHAFVRPADLVPITDQDRAAAHAVLRVLLAVAEFDVAPAIDLAVVESLYGDPRENEAPRPPWQLAFVRLVRQSALFLGSGREGRSAVAHFVERLRTMLESAAPDAPDSVLRFDAATRARLETRLLGWRASFTWSHPRGWFAELDERAQALVRTWSRTCGERWAPLSQVNRRRGWDPIYESSAQPRAKRRLYVRFDRRPAQGLPELVEPSFVTEQDARAVQQASPPRVPTSVGDLGRIEPGINEPMAEHWSVAAAIAEELERLSQRDTEALRETCEVPDALRAIARRSIEAVAQVAWFTHARPQELQTAYVAFDRLLVIASRGMPRWQCRLVWAIGRGREKLNELLAKRDLEAVDAFVYELLGSLSSDLPDTWVPTATTLESLPVGTVVEGRGGPGAASAHAFARRWCEIHGCIEFPEFPASQRLAGPARRLRSRPGQRRQR